MIFQMKFKFLLFMSQQYKLISYHEGIVTATDHTTTMYDRWPYYRISQLLFTNSLSFAQYNIQC